jgi:hypothetical protein
MRLDRRQGTEPNPPGETAGGCGRALPPRSCRPRAADFDRAYETAFARLHEEIEEARGGEPGWPRQAAAGIRAVLRFAAEDPTGAAALTTDALAQGSEQIARYKHLVEYMASLLAPGRNADPGRAPLPDLLEEALAGGIFMLIGGRLEQGRQAELPGLAGEAVEFALTPYLGREEARRLAAGSGPRFATAADEDV